MKKLVSGLLIVTLLFSLVACGDKDKRTQSNYLEAKNVEFDIDDSVFPENTKVEIKQVKKGISFSTAEHVLKNIAEKFILYDINATNDGESVQPDGTVKVSFPITKGFDTELVAVVHVTKDGAIEEVPYEVNKKAKTITATLSHFSLFAVIQSITEQSKKAEISATKPEDTPPGNKVQAAECLHVFIAATCTTAKVCDKCKLTQGTPLGHDFSKGVCKRCNYKDPNYKSQAELNGVKYDVGTQVTIEIILKTEDKNVSVCPTYMIYKSTNGKWLPQDIATKGLLADPYGEEPLGESDKGGPVFTDGEEMEYGLWRWMSFDETIDFTEGKTIIKLKYTLAKEGTYKITVQDGLNKEQNQNKYEKALSLKIYK